MMHSLRMSEHADRIFLFMHRSIANESGWRKCEKTIIAENHTLCSSQVTPF